MQPLEGDVHFSGSPDHRQFTQCDTELTITRLKGKEARRGIKASLSFRKNNLASQWDV